MITFQVITNVGNDRATKMISMNHSAHNFQGDPLSHVKHDSPENSSDHKMWRLALTIDPSAGKSKRRIRDAHFCEIAITYCPISGCKRWNVIRFKQSIGCSWEPPNAQVVVFPDGNHPMALLPAMMAFYEANPGVTDASLNSFYRASAFFQVGFGS